MSKRVLILCTGNSCRSQMAEVFFEQTANGEHHARSAGTRPAERVHPEVVETMAEVGIDVAHRIPHRLNTDDVAWADVVITMGCGDECPVFPDTEYADWDLEDPKHLAPDEFREVRDRIGELVGELIRGGETGS